MSIGNQNSEDGRLSTAPRAPRVAAYLTPERTYWVVTCPYCQLHHKHGAMDGSPASYSSRIPHCPSGTQRGPDYYLVPAGHVTDAMLAKFERMDRKRLPILRRLNEERIRRDQQNEQAKIEQAWLSSTSR